MKRKLYLLLLTAFTSFQLHAQTIITIAGNSTVGYSGDGNLATSAELNIPSGIVIDASGNIIISDGSNNVLRKIDASGIITTIAGNSTGGYLGDNGPASAAELYTPGALAIDKTGNIYICDRTNYRIRKINTSGIITTIAGVGTFGFSGDGTPATNAQMDAPQGIAVDTAGNVYFSDGGNARIRKINVSGIISTIAGTGTYGSSGDGNPATAAELFTPQGLFADSSGNLYVADEGSSKIRKIDAAGIITTVAGLGAGTFSGDGGPATSAYLKGPTSVFIRNSDMYITDRSNQRIRKVDAAGIINTIAGDGTAAYSGDGGPATNAEFNNPNTTIVDGTGNIYIVDALNDVIREIVPFTLSVPNLYVNSDIDLYPNPATGTFIIELPTTPINSPAQITITDLSGRTLISQTSSGQQINVNTIGLVQGNYIVRIISEGNIYRKMVTVE